MHKCVCERGLWVESRAGSCLHPHPQGPPYPRGGAAFPSQGAPRVQSCSRGSRRRTWGRTRGLGFGAEPPGAAWLWMPLRAPSSGGRPGLRDRLQWLHLPERRGLGRPEAVDLGLGLGARVAGGLALGSTVQVTCRDVLGWYLSGGARGGGDRGSWHLRCSGPWPGWGFWPEDQGPWGGGLTEPEAPKGICLPSPLVPESSWSVPHRRGWLCLVPQQAAAIWALEGEAGPGCGLLDWRLCCRCGCAGALVGGLERLGSPSVRPAETCVHLQGHLQSRMVADIQAVVGQLHWHPQTSHPAAPGKGTAGLGEGALGQEPVASQWAGRAPWGWTGGAGRAPGPLRRVCPASSMPASPHCCLIMDILF